MEKITKYNYEAFFLDFYEGNLDAIQSEALLDFLECHPELKVEFEGFEQIYLPNNDISFDAKEELFTEEAGFQTRISKHNFESFAIAKIEGLLSGSKLKEYDLFTAKHPKWKQIDKHYNSTVLAAEQFDFPNKSDLIRKRIPMTVYLYTFSSAVAAALLVLFYLFTPDKVYDYRSVAELQKEVSLQEISFESIVKSSSNPIATTTIKDHSTNFVPAQRSTTSSVKDNADNASQSNFASNDEVEVFETSIAMVEEMDVIGMEDISVVEQGSSNKISPKSSTKTMHTPIELLKKEMLNDKPIIEVIADEITAATNEKIKLKAVKGLNQKIGEFALQIGSFSISKKY